MTILLHLRWIGKKKPVVSLEEHWIGVASHCSASDSIAVVNVHFPPSMHPKDRNEAIYHLAEFLLNSRCSIRVLQGNVNADD